MADHINDLHSDQYSSHILMCLQMYHVSFDLQPSACPLEVMTQNFLSLFGGSWPWTGEGGSCWLLSTTHQAVYIDTNQIVTMSLFIYSRGHPLSTSEIILLSTDAAILIQKADICVTFQRVPGKPLASSFLLLNLTFGLHIQNKFITRWDILVCPLSQRWLDIWFLGNRTSTPIPLFSLEDRVMKVQNSYINDRILY